MWGVEGGTKAYNKKASELSHLMMMSYKQSCEGHSLCPLCVSMQRSMISKHNYTYPHPHNTLTGGKASITTRGRAPVNFARSGRDSRWAEGSGFVN